MDERITLAQGCEPLNRLHAAIEAHPDRLSAEDFQTIHKITPGLYSRTVYIPKGCKVLGRIHLTTHQFVISKGVAKIWDAEIGLYVVQSPFFGVTKVGARRAVEALSDLVWTTYHPTVKTDIAEIEKELFL